jgi:hypothetical protein
MVGCIFRICTCGVSGVAGFTVRGRGRRHCHRKVMVYRRNFFSGVAGYAAQVGPPSLRVVPGSTECVGDGGGWEVCRSVLAETTSMSCRSTFVRFLAEAPPPPANVRREEHDVRSRPTPRSLLDCCGALPRSHVHEGG